MAAFFDLLPRSTAQAAPARLPGMTSKVPDDRSFTDHSATSRSGTRFEVRHASFAAPAFAALRARARRGRRARRCRRQVAGIDEVTTRLQVRAAARRRRALHQRVHRRAPWTAWADRVASWLAAGLDSFVYFDNDAKVRAPYDAIGLIERLRRAAVRTSDEVGERRVPAAARCRRRWPARSRGRSR